MMAYGDEFLGKVENVDLIKISTEAVDDHAIGETVLKVLSGVDFNENGGTLLIGEEELEYTSVDEETETVTLAAPLTFAVPDDTLIRPMPLAEEKMALVQDYDGGDSVWCRIPHNLQGFFEEGTRTGGAGETVIYFQDFDDEFEIREMVSVPVELEDIEEIDELEEVLDELDENLNELNDVVLPQLQEDLAFLNDVKLVELDADLANLNDVVLPALQEDLSTLNDTTIPALQTDLNTLNTVTLPGVQNDLNNLNTVVIPGIEDELASITPFNAGDWFPVTETNISDDAITTPKIFANAVTAFEVAADAVEATKIKALAVIAGKVDATSISANEMVLNTLTADQIAANAIAADEITANAVNASEINSLAVNADEINTNAVNTDEINTNAVFADEIFTNAVSTDEISTDAVFADEIFSNAVSTDEIAANAVWADEITSNAVFTDELGANAVYADNIYANQITGDKIVATGISGTYITAGTLDTDRIKSTSGEVTFGNNSVKSLSGFVTPFGSVSTKDLYANGTCWLPDLTDVSGTLIADVLRMVAPPTGAGAPTGSDIRVFDNGNIYKVTSTEANKANIRPIELDLEAAYGLEPLTYESFGDDGQSHTSPGFTAERAAASGKLDPWVVRDSEGDPISFSYSSWTIALQAMVRDLHSRLQTAESRLAEMAA